MKCISNNALQKHNIGLEKVISPQISVHSFGISQPYKHVRKVLDYGCINMLPIIYLLPVIEKATHIRNADCYQ